MDDPFKDTVLPTYLAKRMVENREGCEATESNGALEIRRRGEFLGYVPIYDGCVRFKSVCRAFAGHRWLK